MATIEGLSRQLNLIKLKVNPPKPPVQNYLDSDEWPRILAVMRRVLPAYPDAQADVEQAIARMVPPMGWKQVENMLYKAIEPYMDARIAVAAALTLL